MLWKPLICDNVQFAPQLKRISLDRARDIGMDPVDSLEAGRRVLDPLMTNAGFRFVPGPAGKGSGGHFASGSYVRGARQLEVHFRWSLGLVTYHFDDRELSHEAFMWSVLGGAAGNKYPGFSEDPMQGFRDLADDLERHGREFLVGSDEALKQRFDHAAAHPKPTGFKAIIDRGAV